MTNTFGFYTIKEIAKMLRMSRQAVDQKIRKLGIVVDRVGRTRVVTPTDLEKLK